MSEQKTRNRDKKKRDFRARQQQIRVWPRRARVDRFHPAVTLRFLGRAAFDIHADRGEFGRTQTR